MAGVVEGSVPNIAHVSHTVTVHDLLNLFTDQISFELCGYTICTVVYVSMRFAYSLDYYLNETGTTHVPRLEHVHAAK